MMKLLKAIGNIIVCIIKGQLLKILKHMLHTLTITHVVNATKVLKLIVNVVKRLRIPLLINFYIIRIISLTFLTWYLTFTLSLVLLKKYFIVSVHLVITNNYILNFNISMITFLLFILTSISILINFKDNKSMKELIILITMSFLTSRIISILNIYMLAKSNYLNTSLFDIIFI